MRTFLKKFIQDESGATAIEYGLIAALISVALIAGATSLGAQIGTTFTNLEGTIKTGTAKAP